MFGKFGKRTLVAILACSLATLLLIPFSGCGPSRPKAQNFSKPLDEDTVTMLDSKVTTQLSRQKEWTEEVNGFLKVHTILRNLSGGTVRVEIKTVFTDDFGAELENPNLTWEPIGIDAHADYHYAKLCPVKGGSKYHIFVRIGKTDD
jgi:uncharacterized protein YcfL